MFSGTKQETGRKTIEGMHSSKRIWMIKNITLSIAKKTMYFLF